MKIEMLGLRVRLNLRWLVFVLTHGYYFELDSASHSISDAITFNLVGIDLGFDLGFDFGFDFDFDFFLLFLQRGVAAPSF